MNDRMTPPSFVDRYRHAGVWLDKTVADFAIEAAEQDAGRITHVFEGQPCRIGDCCWRPRRLPPRCSRAGSPAATSSPSSCRTGARRW